MPSYNSQTVSNSPLQSLQAGSPIGVNVWNAETKAGLTSPPVLAPYSLAVALPMQPGGTQKRISIEITFSADPGAFAIEVQTADTYNATGSLFQSEDFGGASPGQITAVNATFFTARVELAVDANFVRLRMATPPANTVTCTANIWAQ